MKNLRDEILDLLSSGIVLEAEFTQGKNRMIRVKLKHIESGCEVTRIFNDERNITFVGLIQKTKESLDDTVQANKEVNNV